MLVGHLPKPAPAANDGARHLRALRRSGVCESGSIQFLLRCVVASLDDPAQVTAVLVGLRAPGRLPADTRTNGSYDVGRMRSERRRSRPGPRLVRSRCARRPGGSRLFCGFPAGARRLCRSCPPVRGLAAG
jgi:hypothetical protein